MMARFHGIWKAVAGSTLATIASAGAAPALGQSAALAADIDLRPGDAADPCTPTGRQARITLDGITGEGVVTVELYRNDPDNFLESEGRQRITRTLAAPDENGRQTVCIDAPSAGTYAVSAYHDKDADRRLDRRFIGIPREPIGLSNNPRLRLAKPRFEDAAFEIAETGRDIVIQMRQF